MVRGASSTVSETLPMRWVVDPRPPHMQTMTFPPCYHLVSEPFLSNRDLIVFLVLSAAGILGNGLLLVLQCGRGKLSSASFTYLRIVAILQFGFFLLPYPLRFLTAKFQWGESWTSSNFLPVLLGVWHFAIISLILCFAIRLQLITNYVRRSRRWTSYGWIAWRKLFCVLPLATITNVSLCFEFQLRYDYCIGPGGTKTMVGRARPNDVDALQHTALIAIRFVPALIYWVTVLVTISVLLAVKFILPKLGSPFATRHRPLFSNLQPLVIALVASQSVAHLPTTYCILRGQELQEEAKMILYAITYSLPCPLLLIMSERLRGHLWLLLSRIVERKKEAVRKATLTGNGLDADKLSVSTLNMLPNVVGYSKLELENSEIDERNMSNHMVRALLRDDAVYRVRFAMHSTVPTVIEETEEEESTIMRRDEDTDIESAAVLDRPMEEGIEEDKKEEKEEEKRTWHIDSYAASPVTGGFAMDFMSLDIVDV